MKRDQKGQTLIELIAALGIAVLVLSSMIIVVVASLNNAQFSRNQNQAVGYTQQGVELLRRMRDTDWGNFQNIATNNGAGNGTYNYCLGNDQVFRLKDPAYPNGCVPLNQTSPIDSHNLGTPKIFSRRVQIQTPPPGNECQDSAGLYPLYAKATVIVEWEDGKCSATQPFCHSSTASTCFAQPSLFPGP